MTLPTPAALAATSTPEHDGVLTSADRAHIARRFASLSPFALDAPARVAANLRPGYTRPAWEAMSPEARLAVLYSAIRDECVARRLEILASSPARVSPLLPLAPEPVAADAEPDAGEQLFTRTTTSVVACAGGCGEWLPARPGRSVLRYCSACKPRRRAHRVPRGTDTDTDY